MGHLKSLLYGSACALLLASLSASSARAVLVNYVPFDDTTNYSATNYGSNGGTTTVVSGPYNSHDPVPIQVSTSDTPPAPFSGWAMNFPAPYFYGPSLDISNTASTFNLDTPGASMTISTWVKWNGPAGYGDQGLVSKLDGGGGTGWAFVITDDGLLQFNFTTPTINGNRLSTTAITAGTWTNVAMTWQEGVNQSLKFYIGGQDAGNSQIDLEGEVMKTNDLNIRIGNLGGQFQNYKGDADDVAMWDTALTPGKIAAITNAPAAFGDYTADKMDALFKLYDAAGSGTPVTIDGKTWEYVTGLTGAAGTAYLDGSEYAITLDGFGAGVETFEVTPEPTSMTLIGICGIAALRRRRRA